MQTHAPLITFLSDYGHSDEFVGVCHGVIARRCPQARVIDISHTIPRHDVREGALVLRDALGHMPAGVHLAIVDPTVGLSSVRRGIALRVAVEDRLMVGPDNGLLWLACERLGGVVEAVDITRSPERSEPVSATFHGRDVFSPVVAAALAAGASLDAVGEELSVSEIRRLALPSSAVEDGMLVAHALRADHFGNVDLNASPEQIEEAGIELGAPVWVEIAGRAYAGHYATSFADVPPGELLLYKDALEMAALAVNRGSAVEQLRVGRDQELLIRPA